MNILNKFLLVIFLIVPAYLNAQESSHVHLETQLLNKLNPQLESIINNHSNYLKSIGLKYTDDDYIIVEFMESIDISSLGHIDDRINEIIDSLYQTFSIFSADASFNNLSYRIFVKTMHKNDPAFFKYVKKPWDTSRLYYYNLKRLNILVYSNLPIMLDTLSKTKIIKVCDFGNNNTTLYYNPCITIYHLFRDYLTETINPPVDKIYSSSFKYKKIEILTAKIDNFDDLRGYRDNDAGTYSIIQRIESDKTKISCRVFDINDKNFPLFLAKIDSEDGTIKTWTDKNGYLCKVVNPGNYTFIVKCVGYTPFVIKDFIIDENETIEIEIKLAPLIMLEK